MIGLNSLENIFIWLVEIFFGLSICINIGPIFSPNTILTTSGQFFTWLYFVSWILSMFLLKERDGWISFSFYSRCGFWVLSIVSFAMQKLQTDFFPIPIYSVYGILSAYAGFLYGCDFNSRCLYFLFVFPAVQTIVSAFLWARKRRAR